MEVDPIEVPLASGVGGVVAGVVPLAGDVGAGPVAVAEVEVSVEEDSPKSVWIVWPACRLSRSDELTSTNSSRPVSRMVEMACSWVDYARELDQNAPGAGHLDERLGNPQAVHPAFHDIPGGLHLLRRDPGRGGEVGLQQDAQATLQVEASHDSDVAIDGADVDPGLWG